MEAEFSIGYVVYHKTNGKGRIIGMEPPFYVVEFAQQVSRIPFEYKDMTLDPKSDQRYEQLRFALTEALHDFAAVQPQKELGARWVGGEVVLVPGKKDTQEKRIPLEMFFKKIVGVREKLRVLEQKINNHAALTYADKLELQGYITRCYGSLTTFNVLFSKEGTPFSGSGGEES
jgi:hypothetical protein